MACGTRGKWLLDGVWQKCTHRSNPTILSCSNGDLGRGKVLRRREQRSVWLNEWIMSSCYFPLTPFFCFLTECITSWLGKRGKASEGAAEQAVINHSDTLQRWLSALLEQQTWRFHPKGLFLSELHRFLWTVAFRQISQPNGTRFSRAAQSSLNVQGDLRVISNFRLSRSSFLFTCLFFSLFNSLPVYISCFLHLCSSFCDCVRKLCLFCSAQLSMAIFCEKHTPCPQQ